MSITLTVEEAQRDFTKIMAQVNQGDEVILAEDGHPVAKVIPIPCATARRRPGSAVGFLVVHDDFDSPLTPEVIESFQR